MLYTNKFCSASYLIYNKLTIIFIKKYKLDKINMIFILDLKIILPYLYTGYIIYTKY